MSGRDETLLALTERVARLEAAVAALSDAQASAPAPIETAPTATAAPAAAPRDLETEAGEYWLARLGIAALITGVAYFMLVHFAQLGVVARAVSGYLLAAAVGGLGLWTGRRYQVLGRILFGGGLAIAYFVTYAIHFVPELRIVESESIALAMLALVVVGIVAGAQRLHSETVAGVALFLGLHTGTLTAGAGFTFVSGAMLTGAGVFFLVKNRWVIVPVSSLIAVYFSHALWLHRSVETPLAVSMALLVLYFAAFTVALVLRPQLLPTRITLAFAILDALGFVAVGAHAVWRATPASSSAPLDAWFFSGATVLLAAGSIAGAQRGARIVRDVYAGAALLVSAIAAQRMLAGDALVVVWALLAIAAIAVARMLEAAWMSVVAWSIATAALVGGIIRPEHALIPLAAVTLAYAAIERAHRPIVAAWLVRAAAALGGALALIVWMSARLPDSLTTLAWGLAAVGVVLYGLVVRERVVRLAGLGHLALTLLRLLIVDLRGMASDERTLTFIALGVALLALSFGYARHRERLRQWL